MGVSLRDLVYPDHAKRDKFDKPYEFVNSSLMNARTTAKEIGKLWREHAQKVALGEIARVQGRSSRLTRASTGTEKAVRELPEFGRAAIKQGTGLGSELK